MKIALLFFVLFCTAVSAQEFISKTEDGRIVLATEIKTMAEIDEQRRKCLEDQAVLVAEYQAKLTAALNMCSQIEKVITDANVIAVDKSIYEEITK